MVIKIKSKINMVIWIVRKYQKYLSSFFKGSCIYTPSCSQYAIEAFQKYGIIKGLRLTLNRIIRCRPRYKGGFDPVR